MKSIIHNQLNSAIRPYEEDMAFKAAYLFSPTIVGTGETSSVGFLKHGYSDDASLKRQLSLLEMNWCPGPEWEEFRASIPELRKSLKKWNDIKHPTKAMIVSRKKLLDGIKENYLKLRDHMLANMPGAYLLLEDLIKGQIYAYVETDFANPELNNDKYCSLSEVMKCTTDKDALEDGAFFLLTDNFFLSEAAATIKQYPQLEGVEDISNGMISLFRFPDLNQYKKEELQSLRESLAAQSQPFAEAVKGFTSAFANNANDRAGQKQRIKHVCNCASQVEQVLQSHVLVRQTANKEREVELMIGVIPAYVVWQYFKEMRALPDQTFEVLANDKEGEKLCPVMAFRYPNRAPFYVPGEAAGAPIVTGKKSLIID